MKNYDDYIVFILGIDDTLISRTLQDQMSIESDLYWAYETAVRIAIKFQKYDQRNINTQSQLDSYYEFLIDYEEELLSFILENKDFEIKPEEDN